MILECLLACCIGVAPMAVPSAPHSAEGGRLEVHTGSLTLAQALDSKEGWFTVPASRLAQGPNPYWVRTWVRVPPRAPGAPAPVLALSLLGSWEAWWDGRYLGANGRVGAMPSEEVPGLLDAFVPIPPDQASEGSHLLLLRVSSHHLGFMPAGSLHRLEVGEASALAQGRLRGLTPALCTLGALLLMGLFHLVRFLGGRRRAATLLLGLLCMAAAALLVLEAWRGLWDYPYPVHLLRLRLQSGAILAVALLLPAAIAAAFGEPRKAVFWTALGLGLASTVLVPGFDGKHMAALGWSLLLATLLAARAMGRGDAGALGAILGLGFASALFVMDPRGFPERGFFLAFGGLLTCLAAVHAHRERRREEQLEAATRVSERLQLELLKRSLQPHFLMNTLGALVEVVEVEPAQAARFIAALGEAYRQLLAVASERTISMGRELALARAHLDLMGHRQGTTFGLHLSGLDESAMVPPAWLLTLLENAFSHNRYTTPTTFTLAETRREGRRLYTFTAPIGEGAIPALGPVPKPPRAALGAPGGSPQERRDEHSGSTRFEPDAAGCRPPDVVAARGGFGTGPLGGGTGSRYLRARLEEAFPGEWNLSDGPTEGGWTTRVEVPA